MTSSSVLDPGRSATSSPSESKGRPKFLIGAGGLVVACAVLGATALLVSSRSSVTNDTALDPAAPAVVAPASIGAPSRVADRWYEDTTSTAAQIAVLSTPPVRDDWYADGGASRTPKLSVDTPSTRGNLVLDRWYLDPDSNGEGQSVPEDR
jgi:hypothetical protein